MDDLLADLLKHAGRTEQSLTDLNDKLDHMIDDHEKRLTKLERYAGKLTGIVTVVTVPLTLLYHRYIKRDA